MMKGFHTVRRFLDGTRAINDEIKYMILGVGAAIVHLVFTAAFGIYGIVPLFLYNLVITIYYLYLGLVKMRSKQYTVIFVSALIEVLFHSAFVSILLGWNWGFMLYTIALVPVAFYLTYTLPRFKESLMFPIVWSVIVAGCYFGVRVVCEMMGPLYDGEYPEMLPSYCYYFNMLITFVILLVFSVLFASEIRYMQRRLEQENKTLGEIARYDPLTHLMNRRSMNEYLEDVLEQAVQKKKSFCLIMADIDDFKKVNDTYGHECGDEVLIAVSNIISDNVRKNDCVCRWGGEEILISLQADKDVAIHVAERICSDVAVTEIIYKGATVKVTLTLGISEYKEDSNICQMIEESDRKLYKGKNNGKNQVVA
ncbi:MAG: GGDEF domain-containing protein [Clostridiales bacterium]|nr:GGDEF domain-containing protein [Clostridiales bacterium]